MGLTPPVEQIEMATVTIDIPDDLKARCDSLLDSGTITALLSRLLNEALEQETAKRRTEAADRLLARRKTTPPASAQAIKAARLAGRE